VSPVQFTSIYSASCRRELENLLFLNPRQHLVRAAILEGIEQFGVPKVVVAQGKLRIRLDSGREVQTVFATVSTGLRTKLAGVMIYTRLDAETILLLHLAVAEEFATHGKHHHQMLALRFVEQLRSIAGRVNGVRRVRVILGRGRTRELGVV
jgi:hypothetical protein